MIRVLIIDDHEMVRLGYSAYLSIQDDIEVVGEAENGLIGYEMALDLRPDIILMDLVMEVMDGIASTKAILTAAITIQRVKIFKTDKRNFLRISFKLFYNRLYQSVMHLYFSKSIYII